MGTPGSARPIVAGKRWQRAAKESGSTAWHRSWLTLIHGLVSINV
jgi:hypothetical protein